MKIIFKDAEQLGFSSVKVRDFKVLFKWIGHFSTCHVFVGVDVKFPHFGHHETLLIHSRFPVSTRYFYVSHDLIIRCMLPKEIVKKFTLQKQRKELELKPIPIACPALLIL